VAVPHRPPLTRCSRCPAILAATPGRALAEPRPTGRAGCGRSSRTFPWGAVSLGSAGALHHNEVSPWDGGRTSSPGWRGGWGSPLPGRRGPAGIPPLDSR
jgi:hypothetical protein